MNAEDTYRSVQQRYASVATLANSNNRRDYEQKWQLHSDTMQRIYALPENANLGVSCGNPLATANINRGETVVDLGSGGGIDVLLAAKKVGPEGKAIGIDMTGDMLELARRNARSAGATNASFIEAFITSIPLPSSTVDCIISNCVINLVPEAEKPLVFQEVFRLLKPGGRVAISDILAKQELSLEIRQDLSLYVGCIAGASQVEDYGRYLKEAGFQDVLIVNANCDLNMYKEMWQSEDADGTTSKSSCCGTAATESKEAKQLPDVDFNFWAGSFKIFAVKPKMN